VSAPPLPLAYADPRGQGTPLLLVHGFSHDRAVWEKLMAALPEALRPIAVDLRGHGASPWSPEGDYTPGGYAADLPALLDALGIEVAHLAGHSLGGIVATLFAARHPERAASLILVDTSPALQTQGGATVAEGVGERLRSFASIEAYRAALALVHPQGDSELLDRLAASGVVERLDGRYEPAFDPGILGDEARDGGDARLGAIEEEAWDALRCVRCPVLLVRGGRSAVLSEPVAHEIVETIPSDARLVTLPIAGHAVMIDDGPGLSDAVRAFVA
jgi:pimeloyl-ACP methyl ester carboxylesterase